MAIIQQHPYIDWNDQPHDNLIRTYSDDETKNLLQVETGIVYDDAIDTYPCRYTYEEVDKPEVDENLEMIDTEEPEVLQ